MTIGVFDSGVGGLTVLHAIHARLSGVGTAYLGDTARVPYGTRSGETVQRYALKAARFLVEREELGALVVACNTASAVAIDVLKKEIDVPVLGVVEPTADRALELTESGRIGIIGTPGTIHSEAYQRAVQSRAPSVVTFAQPCPLFVPLAEEGWTSPSDPVTRQVAERYLRPFERANIDTLILGCTHYPLLKEVIGECLPGVRLADAAESVALELESTLRPSLAPDQPLRRYYVTDLPHGFKAVADRFLGAPVDELIEVDLG